MNAPTERIEDEITYHPVIAVTRKTPFDILSQKETISFREVINILDSEIHSTARHKLEIILKDSLDIDSTLTKEEIILFLKRRSQKFMRLIKKVWFS